ncbi:hypothetical protein L208DRAFT_1387530 [Tricholoma matsutake]|nr:hypothetical protein L208DRAFT_1387530 [Tricholoma matsutake 945]
MSEWNTLAGGERKSCRVSTDEADKSDLYIFYGTYLHMSSRVQIYYSRALLHELQVDYYSNLTPENF